MVSFLGLDWVFEIVFILFVLIFIPVLSLSVAVPVCGCLSACLFVLSVCLFSVCLYRYFVCLYLLSLSLSVFCLSVCLFYLCLYRSFVCLSVSSLFLSIGLLSVCLSLLSLPLSVFCLSVCLFSFCYRYFVCLFSLCLYRSVSVSVCLPVCLSLNVPSVFCLSPPPPHPLLSQSIFAKTATMYQFTRQLDSTYQLICCTRSQPDPTDPVKLRPDARAVSITHGEREVDCIVWLRTWSHAVADHSASNCVLFLLLFSTFVLLVCFAGTQGITKHSGHIARHINSLVNCIKGRRHKSIPDAPVYFRI